MWYKGSFPSHSGTVPIDNATAMPREAVQFCDSAKQWGFRQGNDKQRTSGVETSIIRSRLFVSSSQRRRVETHYSMVCFVHKTINSGQNHVRCIYDTKCRSLKSWVIGLGGGLVWRVKRPRAGFRHVGHCHVKCGFVVMGNEKRKLYYPSHVSGGTVGTPAEQGDCPEEWENADVRGAACVCV